MKAYSLIVSLVFFGCQPTEKQQVNTTQDAEDVKATLVAMWSAIEKGDADRYAAFVHPAFTQFSETDSVLLVGQSKEVEAIRQYTAVAKNVHTEMIDPHVTVNGNVAWVTYYWQDAGTKQDIPFGSHGKSTRIFVKEGGRWLCIHGHYTLLPYKP
jgi:ketosteroid isomerase-like protein